MEKLDSCCYLISMTYNCEQFIDGYIESFNRTNKSQDEKRGLSLPKMEDITTLESELMALFFPGLSGSESKSKLISVVTYHMENVTRLLYDSILLALSYEDKGSTPIRALEDKTVDIVDDLASHFKDIRAMLNEIILSYPSIQAIAVHRVAHHLYKLSVPLVPRMMNEIMHRYTGIDIHPGAEIGESFFIDHGTGVVIGETSIIGNNVKLYQGVTLGALSFPKNGCGILLRGAKRHPTIKDNVTIYANATILGDVTIGENSTIGSSAWIKEDIPSNTLVTVASPEIKLKSRKITINQQ